jgi:hypothetical protein
MAVCSCPENEQRSGTTPPMNRQDLEGGQHVYGYS